MSPILFLVEIHPVIFCWLESDKARWWFSEGHVNEYSIITSISLKVFPCGIANRNVSWFQNLHVFSLPFLLLLNSLRQNVLFKTTMMR